MIYRRLGTITGLVFCLAACTVLAQTGQRRLVSLAFTSELALLARSDVRAELELVADQIVELQKLRGSFRQRMREQFAELRQKPVREARAEAQNVLAGFKQELAAELNRVLLPHQLKRLGQIQLQFRLAEASPIAIDSEEVAKQLEITDDQRQQLRARQRALEDEYRRQLEEIREKARRQTMELLTPEQRTKLQELIGPPLRAVEQ